MLFNKNDKAVSPVVATLVLIVVAIIGAAAVGLLLGAFSGSVQSQASSADTAKAASSELLIGGSTTVQPLSVELSKAYMSAHPGSKVTVQAGGSGAGVTGVEQGVLDIGSVSDVSYTDDYPDLVATEIGGSAVVLIGHGTGLVNAKTGGFSTAADITAIGTMYTNAGAGGVVAGAVTSADAAVTIPATTVLYQRGDISGTEDCFSKFIGIGVKEDGINNQLPSACTALPATSNGDMYSKIAAATTTPAVGFCDFGFVPTDAASQLNIIGLGCIGNAVTAGNIQTSLKAMHAGTTSTSPFPTGLCRSLFYITKGQPSALESNFIKYAISPDAISAFTSVGYFPIYKYF